ncbi:MAG: hypothetical protein DWH97_09445 [Planctomycetota bacterium]|nr:MAG: hypothetical protein DWH97_09445 [Planctomycetota bacterium]
MRIAIVDRHNFFIAPRMSISTELSAARQLDQAPVQCSKSCISAKSASISLGRIPSRSRSHAARRAIDAPSRD